MRSSRSAKKSGPSIQASEDYDAWLLDQAAAVRGRRWSAVDAEHLAEELEDMAALRREALRSELIVVLAHLLKLRYETRPIQRHRRERQWKLDLDEHRDRVNRLLAGSGTLRVQFEEIVPEAYQRARKQAGLAIDPAQAALGPSECPWTTGQILDETFFPAGAPAS